MCRRGFRVKSEVRTTEGPDVGTWNLPPLTKEPRVVVDTQETSRGRLCVRDVEIPWVVRGGVQVASNF